MFFQADLAQYIRTNVAAALEYISPIQIEKNQFAAQLKEAA